MNILGLSLQIIGIVIIIVKIKKLELVHGGYDANHYVDVKTKKEPNVLTLPDSNLTKLSVAVIGFGLFCQIIAILLPPS